MFDESRAEGGLLFHISAFCCSMKLSRRGASKDLTGPGGTQDQHPKFAHVKVTVIDATKINVVRLSSLGECLREVDLYGRRTLVRCGVEV